RRRIHKLLMKLSLKYDILPASLFIHGVKYSGGECHSSGSFADIYVGDLNGRTVALKRLRMFQMIDESKSTQLKRAFHHESLIWRGLDHEHVLSFLGVDNAVFKRSPCMVLPWMELGNVRHASVQLRKSHSGPEMVIQTLTWIHQITLGLSYLHKEGIVHGDLRGPNILVDADRTVKLGDFGLAVFAEGASRNYGSTRGGNARWLAPELIYPEHFGLTSDRPTYAGDVFALGCVCVELVTNQAPYSGTSDNQVIARVPHGLRPNRPTFPDGSKVPDSLWSTVTLCWQETPSHRPSIPALVEATRGLITARDITPPDLEDVESENPRAKPLELLKDPLLGERAVDSTIHPWAGDRHDWQEYLLEKTLMPTQNMQPWSRSHLLPIDPPI
ncbi:kinase-like domain-containing protein, partial [Cristinia sonorae]